MTIDLGHDGPFVFYNTFRVLPYYVPWKLPLNRVNSVEIFQLM